MKTQSDYTIKWRTNNPEKWRNGQLKWRFGITLDEYNEMLLTQNNACAICLQPCSSGRNLAVDHDHETNKIRGLLCGNCNAGLGRFKDSPERLIAAADYLKGEPK